MTTTGPTAERIAAKLLEQAKAALLAADEASNRHDVAAESYQTGRHEALTTLLAYIRNIDEATATEQVLLTLDDD